jgi:2-dehydropantoate 2-reductase
VGIDAENLVVRCGADTVAAADAVAAVMRHVGPTKASMQQDLERGSRTEVDVINGGIVATARAHGIAAPLNEHIVSVVHAYENGHARPSTRALTEIADRIIPRFWS